MDEQPSSGDSRGFLSLLTKRRIDFPLPGGFAVGRGSGAVGRAS